MCIHMNEHSNILYMNCTYVHYIHAQIHNIIDAHMVTFVHENMCNFCNSASV